VTTSHSPHPLPRLVLLTATLCAATAWAGAYLPPNFPSPVAPPTTASPEARAFLKLLTNAQATPDQRQEAWTTMLQANAQPPKAVKRAVDKARTRAWKQLDGLIRSADVRKVASRLRKAVVPHQAKARQTVHGTGFTKPKLDQAMAPIVEALDEAIAPLKASEHFATVRATIDEMESYAAACGLRAGWSTELGDTLYTLRLVGRYAAKSAWLKTLDANRRIGASVAPGEFACVARLNIHRILLGIRPAEIDLRLVVAAKKHCEEMVAKSYFSHTSPTPALASPWTRAGREHTRSNGECIAAGSRSGVAAFRMWYYSQGHHTIMINGSAAIGVGRARNKWTLMTGSSRMRGAAASRMSTYVRQRYRAANDAGKLLDLAKWCTENHLLAQAQDELARVLALDPNNAAARNALDRLRAHKP